MFSGHIHVGTNQYITKRNMNSIIEESKRTEHDMKLWLKYQTFFTTHLPSKARKRMNSEDSDVLTCMNVLLTIDEERIRE